MKNKSEAFIRIDKQRDMFNSGRLKVTAKDLSCVVYLYDNSNGLPVVKAYKGRSLKPAFCYYYKTPEARNEKAREWMMGIQNARQDVSNMNEPRDLKVDEILKASWGYDQVNVSYYIVIALVGKTMADLQEVGSIVTYTDGFNGTSSPDIKKRISEVFRRKVNGNRVKIENGISARRLQSKKIVGCTLFKTSHFSTSH